MLRCAVPEPVEGRNKNRYILLKIVFFEIA